MRSIAPAGLIVVTMQTVSGAVVPAPALVVQRKTLAALAVATAIGSSTIVFSEPAPTDVMMLAVIVAIPVLGVARFGRIAVAGFGVWLAIVALGLFGTTFSATFDTAVKHQAVTFYLAAGGFVLAGYVAADPLPRMRLIFVFYVIAAVLATVAATAGYFRLFPDAYDLFTSYGRARGPFKDPNVYGAAIAPAIIACIWVMLRGSALRAAASGCVTLFLLLGVVISFSRGAWFALSLSLMVLIAGACVTARHGRDLMRLALFVIIGSATTLATLLALTQVEEVRSLLEHRASLDQSYDSGPDGRFGGQAKALRLILDHPLGIGTHTFRDIYHREEPHNVYLSMFLNAGWLGGLLYVVAVAATLVAGLRRSLEPTAVQGPMLVVTAAFAGFIAEGFVIDTDHWRSFFILMGCLWGLADAPPPATASRSDRPNCADRVPPRAGCRRASA